MKGLNIQIKEVPNKIFLAELQNRLQENKIKEKELASRINEINPRRGEVYEVEITDAEGYEQKGNEDGKRLVVVVSNNQQNAKKNVIVIVPLSSKVKKIYPFQVPTYIFKENPAKPNANKCEQLLLKDLKRN